MINFQNLIIKINKKTIDKAIGMQKDFINHICDEYKVINELTYDELEQINKVLYPNFKNNSDYFEEMDKLITNSLYDGIIAKQFNKKTIFQNKDVLSNYFTQIQIASLFYKIKKLEENKQTKRK